LQHKRNIAKVVTKLTLDSTALKSILHTFQIQVIVVAHFKFQIPLLQTFDINHYRKLLLLLLLQPLYGPVDFVQDYPGEPAPER